MVFISLIGCKDNRELNNLNYQDTKIDTANLILDQEVDTFFIDLKKSVVKWKGTKLKRTGKHEGTVRFKQGKMFFSKGNLVGGELIVDMLSIYNTDIPKSEPVPRKKLTEHLNNDLETEKFPTASFKITSVEKSTAEVYKITGNMTIKGISKSISVPLKETTRGKDYFSIFTFDRFIWKIGENGSWLEKKVVDANVTLKVEIVLLKNSPTKF